MELDFDNLRTQTVNSFNDLVIELSKNKLDKYQIKKIMHELRGSIVFLTCLESDSENFKSLDIKIESFK